MNENKNKKGNPIISNYPHTVLRYLGDDFLKQTDAYNIELYPQEKILRMKISIPDKRFNRMEISSMGCNHCMKLWHEDIDSQTDRVEISNEKVYTDIRGENLAILFTEITSVQLSLGNSFSHFF